MNDGIKPGYKTTEFWLTVLVNAAALLQAVAGLLDPEWAGLAMAIADAMYALSRGLAKQKVTDAELEGRVSNALQHRVLTNSHLGKPGGQAAGNNGD